MASSLMPQIEVQDHLRRRIIAELHLGRLKPGDRAPSLRTVASELGVGIRAVSRAYTALATEGLVTIRGRSGVYAAPAPACEPPATEPQTWYAAILTDAWVRRIPLPALPELLQRYVSRRLRCACVESTADHMVAFSTELDEDFGLDTEPVRVTGNSSVPLSADDEARVQAAIAATDFVVTTAFHAAQVRPLAEALNKSVVIVSINEAIVRALQAKLQQTSVVVLVADPEFERRVQRYLVDAFAPHGKLTVMRIYDYLADPGSAGGAEPMATRAARQVAKEPGGHLVYESVPFLSLTAARELTQCMIAVHEAAVLQPA